MKTKITFVTEDPKVLSTILAWEKKGLVSETEGWLDHFCREEDAPKKETATDMIGKRPKVIDADDDPKYKKYCIDQGSVEELPLEDLYALDTRPKPKENVLGKLWEESPATEAEELALKEILEQAPKSDEDASVGLVAKDLSEDRVPDPPEPDRTLPEYTLNDKIRSMT